MDIYEYIKDKVLSAIGDADYDRGKMYSGIMEYAESYGYFGPVDFAEPKTIKKAIDLDLERLLSKPKDEVIMFFSNYGLIEDVKLLAIYALDLAVAKL